MEHLTAASSNDINGSYHMYKDDPHASLLCNRTSEGTHKNIPLFHSNLHSSSIMCASQDVPAPQICAGRTPIEPFRRDGRDTLNVSSSSNIDALSSFHETSSGLHDNGIDESMRVQMQRAPSAHSSPEALLDVISTAQTKLRQLQAIAELLVQGGGQAQQQQSLVASMKSIMSQLYAATAGFYGQPAPANSALQLNRASIAQLSQALDLTFDDFPTNEMNSFTSSCLGSILGAASNEGFFSLSNTLPCSETTRSAMELVCVRSIHAVQMGPDLTRSAMEHTHIGGLGGSKPSGVKDPQLKKQRLNSSSPNPIRHNNTSNMPVENRVSNESPRVVVETCDNHGMYGNRSQEMFSLEDHDYASIFRDDDDEDVEGENLPPGSYELVEMAAAEILAEHTHFCEICGKGFKRDANLRMHMRGHGDEYKTPAALSRPDKYSQGPSKLRRYSCPYMGCKRNKKHRKFQPLKTTLCVKNHYRRSHCPKLLLCSKCKTKKFSVVADLKTHEKHCGQDKWLCSCGTTFSRKDKLVGHVSLFAGHTPALPIHEMEGLNEPAREGESGGSEGLSTSKPSYLTEVDSFSMSSENGQTFINTLMTENDNGMHIPDKSIMGKEVLMSDNYGQQKCPVTRVYPGEKSSLDNLKRGAMEVMQHCG